MKNIILLLLVIISFGCNSKANRDVSINTSTRSDKELEQLILEKGDSSAYDELSTQYLDYGYERFLPFAIVMANRYNYTQAYFDVFDCLLLTYGSEWNDICLLDSITQNIAIEYLRKATINGHPQALEVLKDYQNQGLFLK